MKDIEEMVSDDCDECLSSSEENDWPCTCTDGLLFDILPRVLWQSQSSSAGNDWSYVYTDGLYFANGLPHICTHVLQRVLCQSQLRNTSSQLYKPGDKIELLRDKVWTGKIGFVRLKAGEILEVADRVLDPDFADYVPFKHDEGHGGFFIVLIKDVKLSNGNIESHACRCSLDVLLSVGCKCGGI